MGSCLTLPFEAGLVDPATRRPREAQGEAQGALSNQPHRSKDQVRGLGFKVWG